MLLVFPPPPCSLNCFCFPLASLAQRCSCTYTPLPAGGAGDGAGDGVLPLPALSSAGTIGHFPPACAQHPQWATSTDTTAGAGVHKAGLCLAPGVRAGLCVFWVQHLGARSVPGAYPTSRNYTTGRGQRSGPGG